MVNHKRGRRMYRPRNGEVWICAKCGKPIDSLPFDPAKDENGNLTRPVYHRECLPPKK